MLTKIRNSVFGFVVVAIAAAAAIYLFDPTTTRDRDWVLVTALVRFDPPQRSQPVIIVVAANAKVMVTETGTESPWQESVSVKRGSEVTLSAAQEAGSGSMQCSMSSSTAKAGPSSADLTPRPGVRACLVSMFV